MARSDKYSVQYTPEFDAQITEAPPEIRDEYYREMEVQLQDNPESRDGHEVQQWRGRPDHYLMWFRWTFAAVSYTVNRNERSVKVRALLNPRLAL